MRDFVIYEHIHGLPDYLDTIHEEITELIRENHYTAENMVEWHTRWINNLHPTDKYGRERNLFVYWIN